MRRAKTIYFISIILVALFITFLLFSAGMSKQTVRLYQKRESAVLKDRNGAVLAVLPNKDGYYAEYLDEVPPHFAELLLKKEDKYFYYHPGINPISAARGVYRYLAGAPTGASTITQQLAKILLETESDRSLKNKIREALYAVSVEIRLSKKEILKMYVNSVYFGNQAQGLASASRLYFGSTPPSLSEQNIIQLLTGLSGPTLSNPFTAPNAPKAEALAKRLGVAFERQAGITIAEITKRKNSFKKYAASENSFEPLSLGLNCPRLLLDRELNDKLREILRRNLAALAGKNASHGAIAAVKLPENELIALIGSPDPEANYGGYQINMAVKPRPIGSTFKPFIYLQGFAAGLRPYSLVEDKEYKYTIGDGFSFYPKNYDYQYRGRVSLHYALANSLNVPTVKVLEYAGLENFYEFLLQDLNFRPIQPLADYQLGIALGGLEMDLLTLTYYFSIFANNGDLKPLRFCADGSLTNQGQTNFRQNQKIGGEEFVQLVNKILTDRQTGVEQFGLKNNLILPGGVAAAVKTGTSREFHDSWTIGFTPDFLVGVWLGNAENEALNQISGEGGAGIIWQEVVQTLLQTPYHQNNKFDFGKLREFRIGDSLEYGLAGDDYYSIESLLVQKSVIESPHNGDVIFWDKKTRVPLRAAQRVRWYINDQFFAEGREAVLEPQAPGINVIEARPPDGPAEKIEIFLKDDESD